jgi:hypothetical protein
MTQPTDDLRARFDGDNERSVNGLPIIGEPMQASQMGAAGAGFAEKICTEALAQLMLRNELATGHGETFTELLGELEQQVSELRTRLLAAETAAAQNALMADSYQGLLAEAQLGKALIEWAAEQWIGSNSQEEVICLFCNVEADFVFDEGFENGRYEAKHKPDCLHLLAKAHRERSAAATAPQGGRG